MGTAFIRPGVRPLDSQHGKDRAHGYHSDILHDSEASELLSWPIPQRSLMQAAGGSRFPVRSELRIDGSIFFFNLFSH